MDQTIELTHKVIHEIVETANDIDAYLASDVPIECYKKDIDHKLMVMKEHIAKMILETTGVPVTITNSVEQPPIPNCPNCNGERELNGTGGYICCFCGMDSGF